MPRREEPELQAVINGPGGDAFLQTVWQCPHRGPVLPTSQQPECGCAELSACLKFARGVSLDDCLFCRLKAMPR